MTIAAVTSLSTNCRFSLPHCFGKHSYCYEEAVFTPDFMLQRSKFIQYCNNALRIVDELVSFVDQTLTLLCIAFRLKTSKALCVTLHLTVA